MGGGGGVNTKYREDKSKRSPEFERTSAESFFPRTPLPYFVGQEIKTLERAKIKTSKSLQKSFVGGELRVAKNDKKINFGQLWNFFNKFL